MLKRVKDGDPDVPSVSLINRLQSNGDHVSLGRATDSTVVLQSARCPRLISRHHAVLKRLGDELILQDLGSTNGTFVKPMGSSEEKRLAIGELYSMEEGDQVSFGGGQKVVQSTGNPEEENPFHFRLKDRYVIFLANAPRQDVLPPVRLAAASDVVDLTECDSPAGDNFRPRPSGANGGPRSTEEAHLQDLRLSGSSGSGGEARAGPSRANTGRVPDFDPFLHASEGKRRKRVRTSDPIDLDLLSSGDEDGDSEIVEERKPAAEAVPPIPTAAGPSGGGDGGAGENASVLSTLECQICREPMVATHSLVPCGHAFCGECIGEWLQKQQTCPTCRTRATAPPVPSLMMDHMLEEACPKHLDREAMDERKRRQEGWKKVQGEMSNKLKAIFQVGGARGGAGAMPGLANWGMNLPMLHNPDFSALLHEAFAERLPHMRAVRAHARAPARQAAAPAAAPRSRASRAPRGAAIVNLPAPNPSPPLPPAAVPEYSFVTTPSRSELRCAACNFPLLNSHPAIKRLPPGQAGGASSRTPPPQILYHLTCELRAPGFVQVWRANNGNLPGRHILPQLELTRLQGLLQNGGHRTRASGR